MALSFFSFNFDFFAWMIAGSNVKKSLFQTIDTQQ